MEKLCGLDSLQVVCHRFSDGVDVVKCVSGFIKEVGDVEQSYSNSLEKLVKSHLYNFHSNFLTQLLGSSPYEEMGTVKRTWSELGSELITLAKLHAEKAQAYLENVRRPLLDLVPALEETRRELRNKIKQLKDNLDMAANKHQKERQKYLHIAENLEKTWKRLCNSRSQDLVNPKAYLKSEERFAVMKAEFFLQELVYREAQRKHVEVRESFDRDVKELYKNIHDKETERVNTIKKSLQGFAKILSNTAPAYLESMQRIVISVDQISGDNDIDAFVQQHMSLMQPAGVPEFEVHPIAAAIDSKNGCLPTMGAVGNENQRNNPPRDLYVGGDASPMGGDISPTSPMEGSNPVGPREVPTPDMSREDELPVSPIYDLHSKSEANSTPKRPTKAQKPASIKARVPSKESFTASERPALDENRSPNHVSALSRGSSFKAPHPRHKRSENTKQSFKRPLPPAKHVSADNRLRPTAKTMPLSSDTTDGVTARTSAKEADIKRRTLSTSYQPSRSNSELSRSRQLPIAGDQEELRLLLALQQKAENNDYYNLFGISPKASADEVGKARRDKSRELHPDHFANDENQRGIAEKRLSEINQIFQNVLRSEESRQCYDQLCSFRKKYHCILEQDLHPLENAKKKLTELKRDLKKKQCPLALVEELDSALNLINIRIAKIQIS